MAGSDYGMLDFGEDLYSFSSEVADVVELVAEVSFQFDADARLLWNGVFKPASTAVYFGLDTNASLDITGTTDIAAAASFRFDSDARLGNNQKISAKPSIPFDSYANMGVNWKVSAKPSISFDTDARLIGDAILSSTHNSFQFDSYAVISIGSAWQPWQPSNVDGDWHPITPSGDWTPISATGNWTPIGPDMRPNSG